MPNNFRRVLLHKNISGGGGGGDFTSDGGYQYLDALIEKDERRNAIECADEVEIEEVRTRLPNADNCGVGDASFTCVAPCAITAVCHMALLKQSTTSSPV
jgi:hypothetical protein